MGSRLIIVACAVSLAAGVGVVVALEDDDESRTGGPLRIVVDQTLRQGERARIRIANVGEEPYLYERVYPACYNLQFFDEQGRQFKIPPGTHCDIKSKGKLKPGEERRLVSWKLDECVRDRWGCVKSEPLPPGTYRIEGNFKRADGGMVARPMIEVQILKGSEKRRARSSSASDPGLITVAL